MGNAVLAMLTCDFVSFVTAVCMVLFVIGWICLVVAIVTPALLIASWLACSLHGVSLIVVLQLFAVVFKLRTFH